MTRDGVLGSISAGGSRRGPSLHEVGGPVGESLVVGRSSKAAFIVRHLEAYSEGLAFTLELRVKEPFASRPDIERQCLSFVKPQRSPDTKLVVESTDSAIRVELVVQHSSSIDPTLHAYNGWGGGAGDGTGRWYRGCFVKPYPMSISFSAVWHELGIYSAGASLSDHALDAAKDSIVQLD